MSSSPEGSGTRLGFEGPKGTYPIAPVSAASLFQIHAEKVVALSKRHGRTIPLYIMTSPENNEVTARFFEENGKFGLAHVRFFVQGQMPAVDRESGQVLLADKGRVALSPDGHGGTLYALAAPGPGGSPSCLDEMRELGVRTLFYFQVDNPMVKIADPAFLGLHRQNDCRDVVQGDREAGAPEEKLGVVVRVDGKPQVIEYSDLPAELAELARARRRPPALGRQHRRARPGAVVRRAAGPGAMRSSRSTGRSRRSPTSTPTATSRSPTPPTPSSSSGSSSTPSPWPRGSPWSRPIAPSSSSRSRTPPARTPPPPSASG